MIAAGYRAVPYVAAGRGLRGSEIFGLELDDLDLDPGEIRVARQLKRMSGAPAYLGGLKSRSSRRTVELPETVAEALCEHITAYPPATIEIEDRSDPRNLVVRLALGRSSPMITLNTYAHEWPDALDRIRALVDTALRSVLR